MATTFDCLNTDLLLEIFDYLSFTELFLAFFNLQHRINNAIRIYPACIDLSEMIDRNALTHGPFRCRALIVSDVDSKENHINYSHLNFEAIRAIEFKYVHFTLLQSFFEQLPIRQLESIIIERFDRDDCPNDIDQKIWSAIAIAGQNQLRYLRAALRIIIRDVEQLLSDLPNLQCAIFKSITTKEMLAFTRHTPNLRSFTGRITTWDSDSYASDFRLPLLTHLELHIERCSSFEELHQLLSICPFLTHFILRFWITANNAFMVNATVWQTLIEQCLPCLKYLKLRLFRYVRVMDDLDEEETFESEYWLKRQPQFDIKV